MLKSPDFDLEELKATALQDLKQRWSSADRKEKEAARYKIFQDKMIMYFNNYYEDKFKDEKAKMEDLITRLLNQEKDMHFCKTQLQRMIVTLDSYDTIINEKADSINVKVQQQVSSFKSQLVVQLMQLKDNLDERLETVQKHLTDVDSKNEVYDELKTNHERSFEIIQQHSKELKVNDSKFFNLRSDITDLQQRDEETRMTLANVNMNILNNHKLIDKNFKLSEFKVDELNGFFSEEITWLKNISKNFHVSFHDYKENNENTLLKLNKTIDLILSGETSYETYKLLLKSISHYYKQYEFYKLIGIQQQLFVQRKENGGGALDEKILKMLNSLKNDFSEKFLKEQRIKIANELSECARRIAFYIVVKTDNYVTSYYILNHLLKVNSNFDHLAHDSNNNPNKTMKKTPEKQKKDAFKNPFENTTSEDAPMPFAPAVNNNTNNTTGSTTTGNTHNTSSNTNPSKKGNKTHTTKKYSYDDNEYLNKKFFPNHPMPATMNAANINIESVREEYLKKIKTELTDLINNNGKNKDEKRSLSLLIHDNPNDNNNNDDVPLSHDSILDYLTVNRANQLIIQDIREKFLIQFMRVINLTLSSFPKIPLFNGVQSFLRTNALHSPTRGGVVGGGAGEFMQDMDLTHNETCLACNRPMILQEQPGGNQKPDFTTSIHNKRPKSASAMSSTYHHKNPFANIQFQPFMMTLAGGGGGSAGNTTFVPITLSEQQQMNNNNQQNDPNREPSPPLIYEDFPLPSHSHDDEQDQKAKRPELFLSKDEHDHSTPTTTTLEGRGRASSPPGPLVNNNSSHHLMKFKSSNLDLSSSEEAKNLFTNSGLGKPPTAAVASSTATVTVPVAKKTKGMINSDFVTRTTLTPVKAPPAPAPKNSSMQVSQSVPNFSNSSTPGPEPLNNNARTYILETQVPVMTGKEMLVDSLAHQFPKEMTIHSKHIEAGLVAKMGNSNNNQQQPTEENDRGIIFARKLKGKEEN
jgi:hypothetical protein